jgi:hypothetical protein
MERSQLSNCPITDLALFKTLDELHDFLLKNSDKDYQVADDPMIHDLDNLLLSELIPKSPSGWLKTGSRNPVELS